MNKLREYVKYEYKEGKYKYGYYLQKLDIQFMMNLGISCPSQIKEIYGNGFKEEELPEYVYFKDPEVVEFISRQYYIRDFIELANMNLYEMELLLKYYEKQVLGLEKTINRISNKEKLVDLETKLKILKNEMQSIIYLRDDLIDKNIRK